VISVSSHRGYGVLRVEDSGCGIQPQDLQKIFEPFERVGNYQSRAGLGLGLYICRAIVEAHQGTISASSQPGKGAVFEVRLPLSS
jgi:signal transduction histidine kinase